MRRLPLLAAALTLLLLPAPAADARSKPRPCAAKGSTTVARNAVARVYETGVDEYALYGCLYRQNRPRLLSSWFSCDCSIADESAPEVWLRGRIVVVHESGCAPLPPYGCSGFAESVALRSGRAIRRASTGGAIDEILVRRNGSFAFLSGGELIKADRAGTRVLDPGPGIDGDSLAVRGSILYWLRGGVAQWARFR